MMQPRSPAGGGGGSCAERLRLCGQQQQQAADLQKDAEISQGKDCRTERKRCLSLFPGQGVEI